MTEIKCEICGNETQSFVTIGSIFKPESRKNVCSIYHKAECQNKLFEKYNWTQYRVTGSCAK